MAPKKHLIFYRRRVEDDLCSQGFAVEARSSAPALESAQVESEAAEIKANDLSRRESHAFASSSNGTSNGQALHDASDPSEAAPEISDVLAAEITLCDEVDDIVEIIADEADLMSASGLAAALKRWCFLSQLAQFCLNIWIY